MMKSALFAALLIASAPALAQDVHPPTTGPEAEAMKKAGKEMHACLGDQLKKIPPSVTPAAGAADAMKACQPQIQAHQTAAHALIKTMKQEEQAAAHKDFANVRPNIEKQLAESISERRSKASAEAAK